MEKQRAYQQIREVINKTSNYFKKVLHGNEFLLILLL
jgi:hypothetical protein